MRPRLRLTSPAFAKASPGFGCTSSDRARSASRPFQTFPRFGCFDSRRLQHYPQMGWTSPRRRRDSPTRRKHVPTRGLRFPTSKWTSPTRRRTPPRRRRPSPTRRKTPPQRRRTLSGRGQVGQGGPGIGPDGDALPLRVGNLPLHVGGLRPNVGTFHPGPPLHKAGLQLPCKDPKRSHRWKSGGGMEHLHYPSEPPPGNSASSSHGIGGKVIFPARFCQQRCQVGQ